MSRLFKWFCERLVCADPLQTSDLIFALAGRQDRKVYALKLFQEGWAERILLSIGRFDVRRFAGLSLPAWPQLWEMRSATPPEQRHFFVSFDGSRWQVERTPVGRLGTLSEIQALGRWLEERPQIGSLLIVSSGPHLRRVRACCRALLTGRVAYRLIAAPEENPSFSLVLSEWAKVALYGLTLALRKIRRRSTGQGR